MRSLSALLPTIVLAFSAVLAACDENVASTAFRTLPEAGWDDDDTLQFPVDTLQTGGTYIATLSLRLSMAHPYPYTDIVMTVERHLLPLPAEASPTDSVTSAADSAARNSSAADSANSNIQSALSTSALVQTDTLTFALTRTDNHSDMTGRGLSLLQYDFPIDTLHLRAGQTLLYRVNHAMRHSPLPGIHDVGLTLRRIPAPARPK